MGINTRPKTENIADKRARRVFLRNECVKKKLAGRWNSGNIMKFRLDHEITIEETREIAKEADVIVQALEEVAGGILGVKEELINSFRTIYDLALNRVGINNLPPDLKSALGACNGIAKLSGLDIQKHEVVSADITATLQKQTPEVLAYIAQHGEAPPGLVLPGFQPRQLVPAPEQSEPSDTDNGTAVEAELLTTEKD